MTEDLVRGWVKSGADEMRAAAASPAVQPVSEMEKNLQERLDRLHEVASRIYDRWTGNLSRGS
jgi:hypothetical protein